MAMWQRGIQKAPDSMEKPFAMQYLMPEYSYQEVRCKAKRKEANYDSAYGTGAARRSAGGVIPRSHTPS